MIISRTPFRISLFGGGTDYPAWFREHGGAVVGAAIDKYCYITVRRLPPFFEHRSRIVYSQVELVHNVSEIKHPAVRGILTDRAIRDGLEIHHDADLPARSGLGSSSSFTVGLLHALAALDAKMMSKRDLAREAIRIEQDVLKENVGSQDQLWAAYGGFNRIEFFPDDTFSVTPIIMPPDRREDINRSLMLFFTGFSRFASDFAQDQIKNIGRRTSQLKTMRSMVDTAVDILTNPKAPLRQLGELLDASWRLKRELADSVSNPQLDEIYEAGREAGAIGGKLLGAGGGGFMVFLVEPELLAESDGRFVLVRSYRHALGSTIWDLPRGFIDPGENAADAALRELTEETGLRCAPANLVPLGIYAPEPGTMAVRAALFAATHCEGSAHQARDELGLESIHLIGRDKMAELVASGEIEDAGLLIAYYRYCAWQGGPHKS
jgi:D-glycero-alpha-D-manno-heptose-7-phosphate kinase